MPWSYIPNIDHGPHIYIYIHIHIYIYIDIISLPRPLVELLDRRSMLSCFQVTIVSKKVPQVSAQAWNVSMKLLWSCLVKVWSKQAVKIWKFDLIFTDFHIFFTTYSLWAGSVWQSMAEQRMECTDGKWKGNHLRDIVFGRTLLAYGHRCQLNSHNLDRNQAIWTMRCRLMQIFSQISWPKDSIRNIAFIHHHFCHFSQVKYGIFTWMVPVLAIVAWLKQTKRSLLCTVARHGLSWFLLRMLRCPENVQSTHPAGWGVAIYLRASWPQHDCKMLQEDVGTRVQSVNMQNNENSMTNDEKWWDMMRHLSDVFSWGQINRCDSFVHCMGQWWWTTPPRWAWVQRCFLRVGNACGTYILGALYLTRKEFTTCEN